MMPRMALPLNMGRRTCLPVALSQWVKERRTGVDPVFSSPPCWIGDRATMVPGILRMLLMSVLLREWVAGLICAKLRLFPGLRARHSAHADGDMLAVCQVQQVPLVWL